jgi:uncharacterized protein (TIGR03435 family)
MIRIDLSPFENHLWQSSLCTAGVWILTLALKNNRAAVRYWLWLAASVKFLLPFSLLFSIGAQLGWRSVPPSTQPQLSITINEISRPFTVSAEVLPLHATSPMLGELTIILIGVWLCGFTLGLIFWVRSLRQICAIERTAKPLDLNLPISVMSSATRIEPGVFGIRKPVLILPAGITKRLTQAQLEAVIAHELCHVRRKDNLTAAIHMVVEVIFWFHPLVWWIRTQLVSERERACDEEVVSGTGDPQIYAEGILNVCKFYLESPGMCVIGVTGSNLKRRIAEIAAARAAHNLTYGKRVLLAAAGFAAVAGPVAVGILHAPAGRAQTQTLSKDAFEVASVKLNTTGRGGGYPGLAPGGERFTATNLPLIALIMLAYDVNPNQVAGVPDSFNREGYDIEGTCDHRITKEQALRMLQTLLADRFKLLLHREMRNQPVYALVVGKTGSKLQENKEASGLPERRRSDGGFAFTRTPIATLTLILSQEVGRTVVDKTGLTGSYDFTLQYARERMGRGDSDAGASTNPNDLPSIFTAVYEQLGLKLEPQQGPVEFVIVDHAEKPSPN